MRHLVSVVYYVKRNSHIELYFSKVTVSFIFWLFALYKAAHCLPELCHPKGENLKVSAEEVSLHLNETRDQTCISWLQIEP